MNQKIEKIVAYAESILSADQTGHAMDHVNRVVAMAKKIAVFEECNLFVVIAAAYLHDTVDDKIVANETLAYQQLEKFLEEIEVNPEEIAAVFHIIKNMSFSQTLSKTQEKLSIEGQIVQDADRLDAMGAIGIARTLYYGGAKGRKLYDAQIAPRKLQTKEEYRGTEETTMNHFYEKILLLNNMLNTEYGKKIGNQRQKFLETFLAEFLAEMALIEE